MSTKINTEKLSTAQAWYKNDFLPWREQAQAYQIQKTQLQQKLQSHATQLQMLVGLLLEGQSKRAVLGWNMLGLEPALAEIVMSNGGETLLLRSKGGKTETLQLDQLITDLEAIQKGAVAP